MILIRGFLDRILLLLGVVAGGCVPSFVAQYHQRVGGRLDQVILDLAPFQQIADRYHGGSMQALINHHRASSDPTFQAEGQAIQAMLDSALRLRDMQAALNADVIQQITYLTTHYDPGILNATLQVYEPAFVLTMDGVLVAVCFGVFIWLLFLGLWKLVAVLAVRLSGRPGMAR